MLDLAAEAVAAAVAFTAVVTSQGLQEHGLLNPPTLLREVTSLLYTPELCVCPACGGFFLSPLNLPELCLQERLLMDPGKECEVTSSHAFQAVSGMWLDLD